HHSPAIPGVQVGSVRVGSRSSRSWAASADLDAGNRAGAAVTTAGRLGCMATVVGGAEMAAVYDRTSAEMFEPAMVDPVVDVLAELAGGGAALELAIGTGRVALPLRARGVAVSGIELSPHMCDRLRAKPGGADIAVTIGDMATARVEGPFDLVYLVFNTIMNVTTQDEQAAVFANAAAHLDSGGCFVVEVAVPDLRERIYEMRPDHVGIDTIDDPVGQ